MIEEHVPLAPYTTLHIGGTARFFAIVKTLPELQKTFVFSKEQSIPLFILGEGSNVLISDKGFKGLVVRPLLKGIFFFEQGNSVLVEAAAGENWDDVVRQTIRKKLFGIENLSYIPGSVGAAPVQNIGAYGMELKDVLEWVEVLNLTNNKIEILTNKECQFSYRDSFFKSKDGKKFVITKICLKLSKKGTPNIHYHDVRDFFGAKKPALSEMREAIGIIRKRKFPNLKKYGTAGSFFKNPIVSNKEAGRLQKLFPELPLYPVDIHNKKIPLAWLLDKVLDVKKLQKNNIGVYKNQALVLVNYGNAKEGDVKKFIKEISKKIKKETGIIIENEVTFV